MENTAETAWRENDDQTLHGKNDRDKHPGCHQDPISQHGAKHTGDIIVVRKQYMDQDKQNGHKDHGDG